MSGLAIGSTLCDDRYRLEEVVGRGGMAIVWRALDLQLERAVAIKVISDVLASDPRFVARFEREARLAAGLNHPNLVKVFDFSVDAERPFLIMEYVPGGTLAEARGRPLDAESLTRELLDAVAHIHGAGILHRDIKPGNVLLGSDGSPRLTDFGIARGDETTGLTQTGQILGTLRYIAPEVAAGELATVQSDLYSLGVMVSEIEGGRSKSLDRLTARLTARDPRDRPRSAAEALAELDPTRVLRDPEPKSPTNRGQSPRFPHSEAETRPLDARSKSLTDRGLSPSGAGPIRMPRVRGRDAVAGGLVLLLVLVVVIAAASGGGDDKLQQPSAPRLAPPSAPADQQLDRLEQMVRAVPSQR